MSFQYGSTNNRFANMNQNYQLIEPIPEAKQNQPAISGYEDQLLYKPQEHKELRLHHHPEAKSMAEMYGNPPAEYGGHPRSIQASREATERQAHQVRPTDKAIFGGFIAYFGNLEMTKKEDLIDHSIWMARITGQSEDARIVYVITPKDYYVAGNKQSFSNLHWVCIQTRTIRGHEPFIQTLRPQSYPRKIEPFLHTQIKLKNTNNKKWTYECPNEIPLLVELLEKEGDVYGYSNKGYLHTALETWQCIITFL
jgi:hypothetical protein